MASTVSLEAFWMSSLSSVVLFGVTVVISVRRLRTINDTTQVTVTSSEVDVRGVYKFKRLVRYLSECPGWDSYDEVDEEFIREFPKVELHVHLDGSFDPDYLWTYLQEHPEKLLCLPTEVDLPWDSSKKLGVRKLVEECGSNKAFHGLCTCRGYRSLKEMLSCFEIFLPLVRRDLDLLEQLAFDFCRRQWEQYTVYTEVRYSPFLFAESYQGNEEGCDNSQSVDADQVFEAVTRGLARGCEQFPEIKVTQILCALTWRPDWAMPTLELALKHRNDALCPVVGIDIAAGEDHFDHQGSPHLHKPHYDMIQRAKLENMPITIHAGESSDQATENVRTAVEKYGAKRIGHGYRMVHSEEVMQLVRKENIHIEVCPTSSVETGGWECLETKTDWPGHPVITMKERGISYSFSSDDPAVFHTSLAWQYRVALAKMGLSREELFISNMNAIDAAFCSEDDKQLLRERLRAYAAVKNLRYESLSVENAHDVVSNAGRFSHRPALSDEFVDRVYVSKSQYY